jgi:Ser-tRNA(Ala) deacylase AlaX
LFKSATDHTYVLEFSHTIFYVKGGGQPFDTGYVAIAAGGAKEQRFNVEAVNYGKGGRLLHFGHFNDDAHPFHHGGMAVQHIDGVRRNMNSRIHTAGHLVSLAIRRLAEQTPELDVTELKAQHYPDASFVEFRGAIDGKYKESIQAISSSFVSDALPIKLYWYKPGELDENGVITVEGMPLVANSDGKIRVVDIVGAGAYPCGGTHVPDSSFVGAITVKNIKRQKGVSKISYAVADK